jgi:hypothetical protein
MFSDPELDGSLLTPHRHQAPVEIPDFLSGRGQKHLRPTIIGSDLIKGGVVAIGLPGSPFPTCPLSPSLVNPDAWLSRVKGQHLVRRVNRQGFVKVDLYPYYISSKLAGQRVTLSIQAQEQELRVVYPQEYRRSLRIA